MEIRYTSLRALIATAIVLMVSHAQAGVMTFTSSGSFFVPYNVSSITVMAIGGGGAGSGSHYTAGGSGYLSVDSFSVVSGTTYSVTVGAGGLSDRVVGNRSVGGRGGTSSFGTLLIAEGGYGGGSFGRIAQAGNGGSGGGGAGNSGFGGAGGSFGSDGVAGRTYSGGIGQGSAEFLELGLFTEVALTAGVGGIESTGSHQGGGGAGGILVDGIGIFGANAQGFNHTGAAGGHGYGAGGGSSGYNGGFYGTGGDGASGLVVVQFSQVPEPASMAIFGTICLVGMVRRRQS